MSMENYRRMAAKIEQHMQQLAAQGINDAPVIFDRMMGYVPDLQQIWVGTTDHQLMALSNEFPGFYRYALIMEEAFEEERKKASRPYDGMQEFSEPHKKTMAAILTTAATLERGYQVFLEGPKLSVFRSQVNELDRLHRQWLVDVECFKNALKADSTTAKIQQDYVDMALNNMSERIADLAKRSIR